MTDHWPTVELQLEMYELEVQAEFCAAHALRFRGTDEPIHGHNFHVTLTLQSSTLDEDGVVADFHEVQRVLEGVIGVWRNRSLNEVEPFKSSINPTAENMAAQIGRRVEEGLSGIAGMQAQVARVRVTEAPGCAAVYLAESKIPKNNQRSL